MKHHLDHQIHYRMHAGVWVSVGVSERERKKWGENAHADKT